MVVYSIFRHTQIQIKWGFGFGFNVFACFLLNLQQRHIAMAFPGGGMPPGGLEGLLGGLGLGPGALDNIWENPMVTSSSFELQYIKSLQMCSRQYFEYF